MPVLVDTDVLIWHLRGYPQATRRLDQLSAFTLSVMSYLELIQGMLNKAELLAVQKMLELRKANVLPLTPAIKYKGDAHLFLKSSSAARAAWVAIPASPGARAFV
jgi:predicted nucleic acid-binding protein